MTNAFVDAIVDDATTTTTENGDKTFSTSLNANVDLFFQGGALRTADWKRIHKLFSAAFAENPELATRIALYMRDIRGGAGERKFFRTVLQYLEKYELDYLVRIIPLVPALGRWDDLFSVMNSDGSAQAVLSLYAQALIAGDGLAAKWAPREKQNPVLAARIRNYLHLSAKDYRKLIATASNTVEQKMCAREWDQIIYSHVPSVASARYAKAFRRHDSAGYAAYLDAVRNNKVDDKTGKIAKINTGAVFPYDVVKANVDDVTADTMWNKLPDYVPEGLSFMPIVDVSGSMTTHRISPSVNALDVALSLGVYLSERNKSAFKDLFITFSINPRFQKIKGGTIRARLESLDHHDWSMSTDLDKAMGLILDTAVKNNVPQSDMPDFLLVMSDMEFNSGGYDRSTSVAERTKQAFEAAGYKLPNIVWWNIASRSDTTPVRFNEKGMALVSGASPAIVKSLLGGEVSPIAIMKRAVMVDKYNH